MTKYELISSIAAKTGIEQIAVKQVVQLTLDGIVDVLVSEGRLELRDFGVFEVRILKARKARNPKTREAVDVPSKQVVRFSAGRLMKKKVGESAPSAGI